MISFDYKRVAEGYAKDRPFLHAQVMEMLKEDLTLKKKFMCGMDIGCGGGLSTKALKMVCEKVIGTDISKEMVLAARALYPEPEYVFLECRAEEIEAPSDSFDIVTAAGVVNWVDEKILLKRLNHIMRLEGIFLVYDFWISDKMQGVPSFTDWWHQEYLKTFPKPPRKEIIWTNQDVNPYGFQIIKQYNHSMTYEFDKDAFIRFMLLQSNINALIEEHKKTIEEVREWFEKSLFPFFGNEKRTLIFEGYNWYIQLIKKE